MPQLKTILSIEDDQLISEMYARALRKAGYEVDEIATGTKGIAQARAKQYDLIILDIFIPEQTGIEVLNELRGPDDSGLANTKIIIMTNYAQNDTEREMLEARVDGYFIKADITPKTLVANVERILG